LSFSSLGGDTRLPPLIVFSDAAGGKLDEEHKMTVSIHPIDLGITCCYLIRDQGVIMVDAGGSGRAGSFKRALDRVPVDPEEIQLVVITHGHWDHILSAKEIKELTGAKIALHYREKDWLENPSGLPAPPGVTAWGRIIVKMSKLFVRQVEIHATEVDVVLEDQGLSLTEYGIAGRVLCTPGHSSGSVSVLLDTGDAFVGDLAMNRFPLRLSPGLPVLAEDMSSVKKSWIHLLEAGAETVYPAHGKPFPAEIIRKALSCLSRRRLPDAQAVQDRHCIRS